MVETRSSPKKTTDPAARARLTPVGEYMKRRPGRGSPTKKSMMPTRSCGSYDKLTLGARKRVLKEMRTCLEAYELDLKHEFMLRHEQLFGGPHPHRRRRRRCR